MIKIEIVRDIIVVLYTHQLLLFVLTMLIIQTYVKYINVYKIVDNVGCII